MVEDGRHPAVTATSATASTHGVAFWCVGGFRAGRIRGVWCGFAGVGVVGFGPGRRVVRFICFAYANLGFRFSGIVDHTGLVTNPFRLADHTHLKGGLICGLFRELWILELYPREGGVERGAPVQRHAVEGYAVKRRIVNHGGQMGLGPFLVDEVTVKDELVSLNGDQAAMSDSVGERVVFETYEQLLESVACLLVELPIRRIRHLLGKPKCFLTLLHKAGEHEPLVGHLSRHGR